MFSEYSNFPTYYGTDLSPLVPAMKPLSESDLYQRRTNSLDTILQRGKSLVGNSYVRITQPDDDFDLWRVHNIKEIETLESSNQFPVVRSSVYDNVSREERLVKHMGFIEEPLAPMSNRAGTTHLDKHNGVRYKKKPDPDELKECLLNDLQKRLSLDNKRVGVISEMDRLTMNISYSTPTCNKAGTTHFDRNNDIGCEKETSIDKLEAPRKNVFQPRPTHLNLIKTNESTLKSSSGSIPNEPTDLVKNHCVGNEQEEAYNEFDEYSLQTAAVEPTYLNLKQTDESTSKIISPSTPIYNSALSNYLNKTDYVDITKTPDVYVILSLTSDLSMDHMLCARCNEGFDPNEKIVNSTGQLWHQQCFVCAQCFQVFEDGVFYEFEDRKYCERDFQVLFAPCCGKCGNFIIGRVIKAMNGSWHPGCFCCELCSIELADTGFIKNAGRALCHECNAKVKARGLGKYVCHKCHAMIDEQPLKFRGEVYHAYHFNCTSCGIELDSTAREVRSRPGFTANEMNELYCLRCHDKMGIPICGACRRPIEERVVTALGKHWHVEHFACAKCEKPFFGHRHYEKKGLAYCETHYHQLFGNLCHLCNQVISGDIFTALNKAWCVDHFACSVCDQKMNQKTKFYEWDLKPVCKKCFERFPAELRKRLKRQHEASPRKPVA